MDGFIEADRFVAQASSFDYWWERQGRWVEPPICAEEEKAGFWYCSKAAQHSHYSKVGHLYRLFLYPLGRPTILREQQAYQSFERLGIKVPRIVYCGVRKQSGQWQGLLVTEALETGFVSLDQWYGSEQHDSSTCRAIWV